MKPWLTTVGRSIDVFDAVKLCPEYNDLFFQKFFLPCSTLQCPATPNPSTCVLVNDEIKFKHFGFAMEYWGARFIRLLWTHYCTV